MRYEQNGTSLWYGTPDAPAPEGEVLASTTGRATGIALTVAVQPIGARNTVEVRYRVNGGASARLLASLARTDVQTNSQYFVATLPEFRAGDRVEYIGVASWPGGQVPAADEASTFPSSFHVAVAGTTVPIGNPSPAGSVAAKFVATSPAPAHTSSGSQGRPGSSKIEGHIFFEHGLPATKLLVRAYDRGFGGAIAKLGEATTDSTGFYSLNYSPSGAAVNVEIRVIDPQGKEVVLCDTKYEALTHEILNLVAPTSVRPLAPEYQRLTADIAKELGDPRKLGTAKEDDHQRDLSMLAASTGWDARLLAMAATATAVSTESGVPADVLYALYRAGLPTDTAHLARANIAEVDAALKASKEGDIISLDEPHAAAAKAAFQKFALTTLQAGNTPGAVSSYNDLLSKSGLTPAEQATFAQLYFAYGSSPQELWQKAEAQGIPKDKISALQLQGRLYYLTLNNAPLTAALQQEIGTLANLSKLVDSDLYQPEQWKTRLNKLSGNNEKDLAALIPTTYGGEQTLDRLDAYAGDLARRVRITYPTHVVARMLETKDLSAGRQQAASAAPVSAFLKSAAGLGYELGRTPVAAFVARNKESLFLGMKPEETASTLQSVKQLHRLYQITPSDESLKGLLDTGLRSAHEVARLPYQTFLARYGHKFPTLYEAGLVYRKAQQVTTTTFSFFSMAKSVANSPGVFAMSPPAHRRETTKQNLIKQYPTMETLFGSLDFCECAECRSVLSPAAYLVDLLQFIDHNSNDWQSFLADWKRTHGNTPYPFHSQLQMKDHLDNWRLQNRGKPDPKLEKTPYEVFVERRPDIPSLPLTCENTNTVMPYIDVVNEILEYFVAHDTLTPESVYDTGTASSLELLAEPQNVLPLAYDKLRQSKYPISLPFDLWLETVRRFLDHYGIKLTEVLEIYRTSDDLFTQVSNPKPYCYSDIFVESLGLSPAEYAIFTDSTVLNNWFALYGYASADEANAALSSAKTLSRRLSVSYEDLVKLVTAGFVNPGLNSLVVLRKLGLQVEDVFRYKSAPTYTPFSPGELSAFEKRLSDVSTSFQSFGFDAKTWLNTTWQSGDFNRVLLLADPDTGCNFDQTTLRYANGSAADPAAFLRIHLVVRLRNKLGWSVEELDRALQVALPKKLTPITLANMGSVFKSALLFLAHLKSMDEHLNIGRASRLKLLTLWSNLPTTGSNPLYAQLFLRRSILKIDDVFDDPLGNYLSKPGVLLKDHLIAVQAALSLTLKDIVSILADAGQDLSAASLSLETVSLLYRYTVLAKALKLRIPDLIALKSLSGLDPLKPLKGDAVSVLEDDYPFSQTLRFVEVARIVSESGFHVEDLNYLLRHQFDPVGKYRRDPNALLAFVKSLAAGLRSIQTEQAVPGTETGITDDLLQQKLALALPSDAVTRFMGMWTNTVQYDVVQGNVPPGSKLDPAVVAKFPAITVSYDEVLQVQRLTYRGVLPDAQIAHLQSAIPSPVFSALLAKVQATEMVFYEKYLNAFLSPKDYQDLFSPVPDGLTDTQKQSVRANNRASLARHLLPYIQQQVSRQFVIQTLTASLGADPSLIQTLLTNQALLHDRSQPDAPLIEAFASAVENRVDVRFYASNDGTGAPLDAPTQKLVSVDTAQKPSGANSAHFEGYFEVPATGPYRFFAKLGKKGAQANLRLDFLPNPLIQDAAPNDAAELSQAVDLKAGVPYSLTFDVHNLGDGNASLAIQGESLPKDALSQLTLYSKSSVDRTESAQVLVAKTFRFIEALPLDERELRYLLSNAADFDGLGFSQLPVRTEDDSPTNATALFKQFRRLAAYARLKSEIAGGSDDLIGVFENALLTYTSSSDAVKVQNEMFNDLCQRLAGLSRRDAATVRAVASQLGFAAQSEVSGNLLTVKAPHFRQEKGLQRLWHALQIIEKIGAPVDAVARWATPAPDSTIAEDIRNTVKARYEPENWLVIAPSLFDKMRQLRRDALVAYIMFRNGFAEKDQLFEYFLIDPGMEPVVQTSRLRLAISSLQTFIQRCLLNLEPEVQPSALHADEWEWMKRYRVWQANREIFLFPENWLEPEFRDDKTDLFQELEGALLQGDVSNDLAEDALFNYLKKLEQIARLEVVTIHCQEDSLDPGSNTLYVIGRTHSLPHKYFHRRYAHQMWTPWEPITTDIEGDHVIAVLWRHRLSVFWLTFLEKANPGGSGDPVKIDINNIHIPTIVPYKDIQVQLNWTEYFQGQWTTRGSGGFGNPMTVVVDRNFDNRTVFLHGTVEEENEIEVAKIHLHFEAAYRPGERLPHAGMGGRTVGAPPPSPRPRPMDFAFRIVSKNSPPEIIGGSAPGHPPFPHSSAGTTHYFGKNPFQVTYVESIQTIEGHAPKITMTTQNILQHDGQGAGNSHSLTACGTPVHAQTPEVGTLVSPFFYHDNQNTFYVEPTLTETTIEQWQHWAIPLPVVTPRFHAIPVQNKPRLVASVPRYNPPRILSPGTRAFDGLMDPGARFRIQVENDAATDAHTVVHYGGHVIVQTGTTGTVKPRTPASPPASSPGSAKGAHR